MRCSSHANSDCPSSDLTLRCHIVMDTLDASLNYFSYKRYHGVVSHDKRFLRFCVFRDGVQSFDPIIDRSRDLSHAVVRKFCPNPRICMQKWPKRQSHLSWDPSANSADSCDICQRLALLHCSSQPSSNVPGFYENPPRVSTGLRPTALLELPRMHAQGALILLSSLTLDYHEDGWFSQLGLELHRRKKRMFPCRANGGYTRCVSLVDLKHVPVEGEAMQLVPFATTKTLKCLTSSPSNP
jgi:hypothetical protein